MTIPLQSDRVRMLLSDVTKDTAMVIQAPGT